MICLQVIYLLLEDLRPEVLAYEFDSLQMISEPGPIHGIPSQKNYIEIVQKVKHER